MILDHEDHVAIASEVVKLMRQMEGATLDAGYLASLPREQRQKIQQEKMRRHKESLKGQQPR